MVYGIEKKNNSVSDYFIASRRLGPWIAALSASASSSSAWTLLGVSGAAYLWGLPALWIFPATLSGFFINWLFIAPKLNQLSQKHQLLTLTEFLALGKKELIRSRLLNALLMNLKIILSLLKREIGS